MTVEALAKALPPPKRAIENKSVDWPEVERAIGTALPADYKEFIQTYGSGRIGDFILVFNPAAKNPNVNLQTQVDRQLGALRQLREEAGKKEVPVALYPEGGGLLPWGLTDNGDVLFWRTGGEPEEWTTVIHESRGPTYEEHPMTMTDLLARLASGRLQSEVIPVATLDRAAGFKPLRR